MVFLIVVTLPMWSAFAALFQDTPLLNWMNLTLAAGEGSARIGDPVGGGNVIAFAIVVGMIALSAYFGSRWNLWLWLGCANIFYIIWILLYTTFLTNFAGVKSGIWQALGYWIVQQGEGRGSQPWYYYFLITSIYEFLPFLLGIVSGDLLPAQAGDVWRVPGILGAHYFRSVHHREREDALASGEHRPALHHHDGQVPL